MTEDNIKLVNEDGKIVGKDPESGETVPIELGETIAESISTESLLNGPLFAGSYDGDTPDERLDHALSVANQDQTVILERAEYIQPRTISTDLTIVGQNASTFGDGTTISTDWTLDRMVSLSNVSLADDITLTLNNQGANVHDFWTQGEETIQINDSHCLIWGMNGSSQAEIVYAEGTRDGVAGLNHAGVNVVDKDGRNRSIGEHPEQVIASGFEENADSISFSFDVETGSRITDKRYRLWLTFNDRDSSGNTPVEMTWEQAGAGDYNYRLEDENLNISIENDADQFELIRPTAMGDFDGQAGVWDIFTAMNRLGIKGRGLPISNRQEGEALAKGWTNDGSSSGMYEVTVSADGGDNVDMAWTVIEYQDMGNLYHRGKP